MPEEPNIPIERSKFKQLLLSNPNYFGSLEKYEKAPVKKISGNTDYEQLTCIGYNLDHSALEATIAIKRPTGYGGDLCSGGSTEYVRFFVDYGTGWEDAGYVSTAVHDIPDGKDCAGAGQKPLTYVVTLPYTPKTNVCFRPVLPKVRGILSWEAVPSSPLVPPVWGNILDGHIQIKPRRWIFSDLVDMLEASGLSKAKLPPPLVQVPLQPIPIPDPAPLTLLELAKTYASVKEVEPHRFGLASIATALDAGAVSPEFITTKVKEFQAAKLDWAAVLAALEKTSGNTNYEELNCLGLDNNREWLVATFRIKRPAGYSGSLCQKGSTEYLAFWVDWDNICQWEYAGTVSVNVHDIADMPPDGLHYTALLPVDLSQHRRSCKQPKIARVRAVLSWGTPPSTTNPDAVPYWGNRIDTHVQINPKGLADGSRISALGGIGVGDINFASDGLTKPNAKFALLGSFADPYIPTRACPFGGQIIVQGIGTPYVGTYYRLWARNSSSETFKVLRDAIWVVNQFGIGSWLSPDSNGFFPYLSYLDNLDQTLGYWYSSGSSLGEVYLEWTDGSKFVQGSTITYKLQLWDAKPDAQLTLDAGPCHFYDPTEKVTGKFVAQDAYFGHFVLSTLPASVSPPSPTTATPSTSETAPAPGDAWSLDLTGLPRCGYVVELAVADRTIVGSTPGSHNGNNDDKGFCLVV